MAKTGRNLVAALAVFTIFFMGVPDQAVGGPAQDAGGAGKKGGDKKKGGDEKKDGDAKDAADVKTPALNFEMKDIDGIKRQLGDYYGQVILMVNTASECGFTDQYEGLEVLYQTYKSRKFVVVAFPANNFQNQEPGTNEEIKAFCKEKFAVTFPLFGKVSVTGKDICDLYKYLTRTDAGHEFGGPIPWNFNKFLIGRNGEIVGRFKHIVHPTKSKKLIAAIEKALGEPIPDDSPAKPKPPPKPRSSAAKR